MSQRIGRVYQSVDESVRRSIQWVSTNDTISTSTWTIRPLGLTLEGTGATTTSTTIQVSGGVVGVNYTVENTIRMARDQQYARNFLVTIKS